MLCHRDGLYDNQNPNIIQMNLHITWSSLADSIPPIVCLSTQKPHPLIITIIKEFLSHVKSPIDLDNRYLSSWPLVKAFNSLSGWRLAFLNSGESGISETHPEGRGASSWHRQEMKTTLCRADDHCHRGSPQVSISGSTTWLNRGKCAGWHSGSNYRSLTSYVTMEIRSHLFSHMYTDRFRVVRSLPFNKSLVFLDCAVSAFPACQR